MPQKKPPTLLKYVGLDLLILWTTSHHCFLKPTIFSYQWSLNSLSTAPQGYTQLQCQLDPPDSKHKVLILLLGNQWPTDRMRGVAKAGKEWGVHSATYLTPILEVVVGSTGLQPSARLWTKMLQSPLLHWQKRRSKSRLHYKLWSKEKGSLLSHLSAATLTAALKCYCSVFKTGCWMIQGSNFF